LRKVKKEKEKNKFFKHHIKLFFIYIPFQIIFAKSFYTCPIKQKLQTLKNFHNFYIQKNKVLSINKFSKQKISGGFL
jgi:hypothetical protein